MKEKGKEIGFKIGEENKTKKVILRMHEKGYEITIIAEILEVSEDFIRQTIKEAAG